MDSIAVPIGNGSDYQLFFGAGIRRSIERAIDFDRYSRVFVLTEAVIESSWLPTLPKRLSEAPRLIIPSGEHSKSLSQCEKVWEFLLENGADRKSLLVNVGGGMLSDLGGFVASTYMRGIDFVHLPTTLLAQVDASIGGKTAVNFGNTKNVVGTFAQPEAVFIDTEFLSTLPERELRSGMAEILKHGLIADQEYFELSVAHVTRNEDLRDGLAAIIQRSCEIKRDIVVQDERESGMRKLLNFGHTFGHALEGLSRRSENPLLHGESVSIGMMLEVLISEATGMIGESDLLRVRDGLLATGLPVAHSEEYSFEELYSLIERDKKNTSGVVSWTLLSEIGRGVVDQEVSKDCVRRCYQRLRSI